MRAALRPGWMRAHPKRRVYVVVSTILASVVLAWTALVIVRGAAGR